MIKTERVPDYPFYDAPGVLAIVHRGGNAAGPEKENSLVAFDSAFNAGVLYGETDTVATSDGIALAIHGSGSKKQEERTGLPLRSELQAMTLDEVQTSVPVGGEQVPTLEEVLITFPGMRFFIDPKTNESVKPLADLINKLKVHDRVSIGAFSYNRTKAVAELTGDQKKICTSVGVIGGLALLGTQVKFPLAKKYLRRTDATQLALPHNRVNESMVDKAHDLGMRVILWTPNTEADIVRSFDTGADGVMSDQTRLVKEIADSRNSLFDSKQNTVQ